MPNRISPYSDIGFILDGLAGLDSITHEELICAVLALARQVQIQEELIEKLKAAS